MKPNARHRRKVKRQLKGFRPREGYPEIIRKAFAGRKIPHNLEVEVDENGKVCLRMHIRVNSWKDATKAIRQMTRAKALAATTGIPAVMGMQRQLRRPDPKPTIVEADLTESELRVTKWFAGPPAIRAIVPGDGRRVRISGCPALRATRHRQPCQVADAGYGGCGGSTHRDWTPAHMEAGSGALRQGEPFPQAVGRPS